MRSKLSIFAIVLGLQLLAMGCQPPPSSPGISLAGEVTLLGVSGDLPIEQARVWIEYKSKVYDEAWTDYNGRFTLSNLPGGEFDIVVEKGEQYEVYRASERLNKMKMFDPNDPNQFPYGHLTLNVRMQRRPTTLSGLVVNSENGDPITGASISTYPSSIEVQTDENGQFVLESDKLELVRTSVSASHSDFQPAQVFLEKDSLRMAGINEVPIIEMDKNEQENSVKQDSLDYPDGPGVLLGTGG
jgi:hypothetical protein